MTRSELLARKAVLLPIYGSPDDAHEMQHVEVTAELDWIEARLREMPAQRPEPVRRAPRTSRDGRALAAGTEA